METHTIPTVEPPASRPPARIGRRLACGGSIAMLALGALSGPAQATAGGDRHDEVRESEHHGRRATSGVCDTKFTIDAKDALLVHITGDCELAVLGRSKLVAEQRLRPLPDGTIAIENDSTYTASNGESLFGHFIGRAAPNPSAPGQLRLSGTEFYIGGTGRFDDASGRARLSGFAQFTGPDSGIGHFETKGTLRL